MRNKKLLLDMSTQYQPQDEETHKRSVSYILNKKDQIHIRNLAQRILPNNLHQIFFRNERICKMLSNESAEDQKPLQLKSKIKHLLRTKNKNNSKSQPESDDVRLPFLPKTRRKLYRDDTSFISRVASLKRPRKKYSQQFLKKLLLIHKNILPL